MNGQRNDAVKRCAGIFLITAALAGIAVMGCAAAGVQRMKAAGGGQPRILYLANNLSEDSCTTEAMYWFADQVKERTDGRVEIQLFNDGELGDSISCLEQLQYGGVDLVKTDVSALSNYVDVFQILAMPYIYQDQEHFERVHNGEIGMELLHGKEMTDRNMYGLTYYDGGSRCFYNRNREIHGPQDMKGMMVRVLPSEMMMSMVERLGGHSVTMDYQEVYAALQPGGVDAAENSVVNYIEQEHYRFAPYFLEDDHVRQADVLMIGERTRESLTQIDADIIEDAALDSWKYQKKLWARAEKEAREKLYASEVRISALSEEEYQEFLEFYQPMWYTYRDGIYNELVDRILACGKKQMTSGQRSRRSYLASDGRSR